jgi:hypothetical protein
LQEPVFEMCFRHEQLVWLFFLDEQNRLCCKNSLKERKRWSEVTILQDSYGGQFVVALDNFGAIHLATTDSENIIRSHRYAKGKWESSVVTEIHPLIEITNLSLTVDSTGKSHLLYCQRTGRKNGEWQITHNYACGDRWRSYVMDSGMGLEEARSSTTVDENDNLHVIYSAPALKGSALKHQVFDTDQQAWKPMEPIPMLHQENLQPCAIFDKSFNLHLVWISSDGRNFRTMYALYKNTPWPEGGWTDPVFVSDKGVNAYSPYLLITGNSITALWQQLNGVFHRVSEDLGQSWGPIEKQTAMQNLDVYALKYFFPGHQDDSRDLSHLNAFSSSGPQVTLSTAAALLQSIDKDKQLERKIPIPSKQNLALPKISEESLSSSDAKKFLLEFSDTRLTNRLINQTINSLEQELQLRHVEIQELKNRLREQGRELNSFKSLSQLYSKDAEDLKQRLLALEDKAAQEKEKLTESLERNKHLEKRLNKCEEELQKSREKNILLQADNQKIGEQLARTKALLQFHQEKNKEGAGDTQPEQQSLPYKMISSEDFD